MPKPKLAAPSKKYDQQLRDLTEQHRRALADYQNLQKRVDQERSHFIQFATTDLLHKFLTVLDHLESAAAHLSDPGLDMVVKEFHQVLSSEAVTPLDPAGQIFDPKTMECVDRVPGPAGQVIQVQLKGYLHHDQLLRPAQVHVGTGER